MNGLEALAYISKFTNFQGGAYKDKLEAVEKELKALEIIKKKVMHFVNLEEEDHEVWDNGIRTGEVVHKYFVYDNELYERDELTKEEFETLKQFYGGETK